jgi:hypothetical protein
MKTETTTEEGEKHMNKQTNNQNATREAQGSSGQSFPMKVRVPREILSKNHRRAYAMAYRAGYTGGHVKYIAPVVRNSIVRGFLDGEEQKAREDLDRKLAELASVAGECIEEVRQEADELDYREAVAEAAYMAQPKPGEWI